MAIDYSLISLSLLIEGKLCHHLKSYSKYFAFPVLQGQMKEANIYFSCKSESSRAAVQDKLMTCPLCYLLCPKVQGSRFCSLGKNTATDVPVIVKYAGSFPKKAECFSKVSVGRCAGIRSIRQHTF